MKWENHGRLTKGLLPKTVLGSRWFQFIGGVGNGVVTKNGTIIFPIQIANNNNNMHLPSCTPQMMDPHGTLGGTTEGAHRKCSVTEWGNGKLLLSARYDGGFRKVYESDDMGTTWKESTMFSGVGQSTKP
ncbi:hypothetical protein [Streptomyces hygroscopicus]|uniref:hypothetical protein n=1 Tax=Streptomyces hygroscopicus TaxID=1912 RepID=UPI003F1A6F64